MQTLHPKLLDHGKILAQTSPIDIPNPETCTVSELGDFLAPKGAELLIQGIRDRLFMLSDDKDDPAEDTHNQDQHTWAPKIRREDSHINWHSWTGEEILRRQRVLGPLWNMASVHGQHTCVDDATSLKRIIMQGISVESSPEVTLLQPGVPFLRKEDTERKLFVATCDKKVLQIPEIKVEGRQFMKAATAAEKDHFLETRLEAAELPVMRFCRALQ